MMRVGRMALACAFVVAAAACGGGGDDSDEAAGGGDGEPYVLGFSSDLSGAFAGASSGNLAGMRAYFERVNAEGGIDGHLIELVVRDDRTDVQVGSADIRDLAEQGVPIVLGNSSSVVWATTANLAEELEVPQIALAAVDGMVYPPRPYLYRNLMSARQAAEGELRFALETAETDAPRIAAIRYESAGTDDWLKALEESLAELGLEPLVANERFPAASTDVAPAASSVAAANPDWVLATLNDPHALLVVDALRNRGYTGPIVNWTGTSEAVIAAVDDPEFYALRDTVPFDQPGGAPLLADAEAAGVASDLNNYSSNGYLAARVVVEALRACGFPCDGPGMDAALVEVGGIDSEGMAGPGFGDLSEESHLLTTTVSIWRRQTGDQISSMVGDWFEPDVGTMER